MKEDKKMKWLIINSLVMGMICAYAYLLYSLGTWDKGVPFVVGGLGMLVGANIIRLAYWRKKND